MFPFKHNLIKIIRGLTLLYYTLKRTWDLSLMRLPLNITCVWRKNGLFVVLCCMPKKVKDNLSPFVSVEYTYIGKLSEFIG